MVESYCLAPLGLGMWTSVFLASQPFLLLISPWPYHNHFINYALIYTIQGNRQGEI